MKKISLVMSVLFCVSSFVCADVVSDLQTKMDKFQKQGISYKYKGEVEWRIVEKNGTKAYINDSSSSKYLFINGKLYDVIKMYGIDDYVPTKMIITSKEQTQEIDSFQVPSYKNLKATGEVVTVNGYSCQLLEKSTTAQQLHKSIDKGSDYTETIVTETKMYVIEKYGFPTKIEYLQNGKPYKETINFTDFTTSIDVKDLEMPEYPFFMKDVNDYDEIKYQQLLKQINEDKDKNMKVMKRILSRII